MHDAKGRPLKVGDKVLIPAVVAQVHPGDDVKAVSTCGRRPDGLKETFYAINTGVMFRAEDGDDNTGLFDLERAAPLPSAAATDDAGA